MPVHANISQMHIHLVGLVQSSRVIWILMLEWGAELWSVFVYIDPYFVTNMRNWICSIPYWNINMYKYCSSLKKWDFLVPSITIFALKAAVWTQLSPQKIFSDECFGIYWFIFVSIITSNTRKYARRETSSVFHGILDVIHIWDFFLSILGAYWYIFVCIGTYERVSCFK